MTGPRPTLTYLRNSAKAVLRRPFLAGDLLRYHRPWLRSMAEPYDALEEEQPWLPFAAAAFLEGVVTETSRVFEYGSGASTLFFARLAATVHSVEHDPAWFGRVAAAISARGLSNCRHALVPPVHGGGSGPCPLGYGGSGYPGQSFGDYVRTVEEHGDGTLDLVVVDGRSRNACIWHARSKVAPGGHLLLDNSERESYRSGKELLAGWPRREFFGPCPGIAYFSRATLFTRPRT